MMITQKLLESDLSDDREQVLHLRVGDKGSLPCCVKMEVQGVHMYGIMDSGADITIIGDQTFKKVATCGPANPSVLVFPLRMYPYWRHPDGSIPQCSTT